MARAIPPSLRQEIVRQCKQGKTVQFVSEQLGLGYAGVAKIWRQYRQHGQTALELQYHRCGRKPIYGPSIRQAIEQARSSNEDLGAPIIRSRLLAQGKFDKVPHERTIQRWWKAQGTNKVRGTRPKGNNAYTDQIHHTWQVDGKENVKLADDSKVCYLSCTDEASCGFLQGHVFPL